MVLRCARFTRARAPLQNFKEIPVGKLSFRPFSSHSSEKFPGVERNVWKVSPFLIVRSRRNVLKGNLSSILVKPSVWYQFWALNLQGFVLRSLNGKRDSRTSCLTFTQTVNRPLCPCKLGKQPSFPEKETYHWIKGRIFPMDVYVSCRSMIIGKYCKFSEMSRAFKYNP